MEDSLPCVKTSCQWQGKRGNLSVQVVPSNRCYVRDNQRGAMGSMENNDMEGVFSDPLGD
jgi:hypothetical protein